MTEEEYKNALDKIWEMFDLDPDKHPKEAKELTRLIDEVHAYEELFFPMPKP